jgi:hypothetical protein
MSFQDFLAELNLTEDECIQAMESTLKQPTVFLKRNLSHIWNNSFSKDQLVMWNANTNAQYVLNAYASASYCTSYMTKVDKSMTSAFKIIRKEHEKSHIHAMQMVRALGNTLFNLQQMSAQQEVHIALSLPLKCVFINTSPLRKHKIGTWFTFGPPKILLK